MELKELINGAIYILNQPEIDTARLVEIVDCYKDNKIIEQGSTIESIVIYVACKIFKVNKLMFRKVQRREAVYARQFVSKYFLDLGYSDKRVGEMIYKHRTSALHGRDNVNNLLENNKEIVKQWQEFTENIKALTAVEAV